MTHDADKLSLKWTFLSLKDETQTNTKRSNSEPPRKGTSLLEPSEGFGHDPEYVTTLWERASKLKSTATTISTAQESGLDNESLDGSIEAHSEIPECDPQITISTEEQARSAATTLQLATLLTSVGGDDQTIPYNLGSAGHPEFCSRPCIFFPLGQCTGGKSCNFCHEEHRQRPPHLDKINRATLRSLPSGDRRQLLLSAMNERASKELSPEKLRQFLQLLRDVFGVQSLDNIFLQLEDGWRDSRLLVSLRRMPLISLYNFLNECSDVEATKAKEALIRFRLASG
jgi:hypothetical protein